jgi:hypothetical protein
MCVHPMAHNSDTAVHQVHVIIIIMLPTVHQVHVMR